MSDVVETFERDLDADRSVARLRLVGALVVGISSVLLGASDAGPLRWIWVVLGGLASLGWFAAYFRGRRPPTGDRLELGADALRMLYQEKEAKIAWSEMVAVVADEDRLHVHVSLHEGELVIPLIWRGIGLHELAERIEAARLAAESQNRDAPSVLAP
ncbi:MAG: hypothetical protein ACI9KE_002902 [Polyangiales bacterium]